MNRMRSRFLLALLLLSGAAGTSVWADSQTAQSNQRTAIYRNISGSTQSSGWVAIFDFDDTDRSFACGEKGCFTDAGYFVEATTSADSDDVAGVLLDDSCLDDQECVFVVEGPAYTQWAGATDNTNTLGADVGTSTVSGRAGSGTLLGLTLSQCLTAGGVERNCNTDTDRKWIGVSIERN